MSRMNRENVIVTSGDHDILGSGVTVWTTRRNKNIVNAEVGQLLFYNRKTNTSVGVADLDNANYDDIVFGVAIDTDGDGQADDIRACYGDRLGKRIKSVNAAPHQDADAHIVDFLYRGDISGALGVRIGVKDDESLSLLPHRMLDDYFFSTGYDSWELCPECTPTAPDSEKLACALVNEIKKTDLDKVIEWNRNPLQYDSLPFTVHQVRENSYEFAITFVDGVATAIKSMVIDADGTPKTVDFSSLTFTGTDMTMRQAENLVDEIDAALGFDGSAALTGFGNNFRLVVMSCHDLTFHPDAAGAGAALTVIAGTNATPLTVDITSRDICPTCSANPNVPNQEYTTAAETFDAGIRFIAKPVDLDCGDCDLAVNTPKYFYSRILEVMPTEGVTEFCVKDVVSPTFPANTGYEVQIREYKQSWGGSGRSYRKVNDFRGRFKQLDSQSKVKQAIQAKCDENYNSWEIVHAHDYREDMVGSANFSRTGRTCIFIPVGDSTTETALETMFGTLLVDKHYGTIEDGNDIVSGDYTIS